MTTVNKNKVQNDKNIEELITALYCRLSVEDIKDEDGKKKKKDKEDESNSISNQKQILLDYCKNTATQIQCSSLMMAYPAQALIETILIACNEWWKKARFAESL